MIASKHTAITDLENKIKILEKKYKGLLGRIEKLEEEYDIIWRCSYCYSDAVCFDRTISTNEDGDTIENSGHYYCGDCGKTEEYDDDDDD